MSDFDRPLEPSGRADAKRMGELLRSRWGAPERILCSRAKRTRETLAGLGIGGDPVFDEALFDGEAADYIEALTRQGAASILLVGHNPSIQGAAAALAAGDGDAGLAALRKRFPPGGLAVLEFNGALSELRRGRCRLEAFVTPADVPAA